MSLIACPSPQELSSLVLGKLPRAEAEVLYAHVDDCADCQAKVETLDLDSDTLLKKLRRKTVEQNPYFQEEGCRRAVELVMAVGREPSFSARKKSPAPAASALQRIREYDILAELGHGGMGTVYKALHTRLKRVVALKVLPPDRLRNADAVSRFQREMEAVGKLDHPHIVRATDAGEHDGTHYLVMEFVDGPNLSQLVKQAGPLQVADACELIRQAAVGLQHAHEHGLVHRDVKPGNLLLSPSGQVKVLDLGLALLQSPRADAEELTSTGQLMGTLDYMAPEQARNTHLVDIRADIYSLGITLFKLLTGRAPFEGDQYQSPFEKMLAHTQEPLPPLTAERDDVPAELLAVFARMTAKEPNERFATPAEVAEALAPFCAGHDLPALLRQTTETGTFAAGRSPLSTNSHLSSAMTDTFVPSKQSAEPSPQAAGTRPPTRRRLKLLLGGAAALLCGVVIYFGTGKGRVEITVNDPDVEITIDGHAANATITEPGGQQTTLTIDDLPAGRHVMQVSRDGFVTETERFWIFRGRTKIVEAVLKPETSTVNTPEHSGGSPPMEVERAAARRVLELGGRVLVSGHRGWITDVATLPNSSFQLSNIQLGETPANDGDVALFRGLRGLQILNLAGANLSAAAFESIGEIRTLRNLGLAGVAYPASALGHLDALSLNNLTVNCPDRRYLDQVVKQKGLISLEIEEFQGTDEDLTLLANLPKLESLVINRIPNDRKHAALTDEGIQQLGRLKNLRRLTLPVCKIEGSAFGDIPSWRTSLEYLSVDGCPITDEGVQKISKLSNLNSLRLNNSLVTDHGLVHLRAIAKLELLYLGKTHITDAGLSEVAKLKRLHTLSVGDTRITDDGVQQLQHLPNLRVLTLNSTNIGDKALERLESVKTLRECNVVSTKVTAAGVAKLRKALPQVTITWNGGTVGPGGNFPASRPQAAADPLSQPGPGNDALPGLVPRPAKLPGVKGWQAVSAWPRDDINAMDWNSDGLLACAGDSGQVRIHDGKTLKLRRILFGHTDAVNDLQWSPDGKTLATASSDRTIRLWLADGTLLRVMKGLDHPFTKVAWNRDGSRLGYVNGVVVGVRNVDGTADRMIAETTGNNGAISWSPDGTKLAVGGADKKVTIYNLDGTPGPVLEGHTAAIRYIAWSPDGNWLASQGDRGETAVRLWKADGTAGPVFQGNKINYPRGLSWLSKQEVMAVDGSVIRTVTLDGDERRLLQRDSASNYSGFQEFAVSRDRQRIGFVTPEELVVADLKGKPIERLTLGRLPVYSVAWSPKCDVLAAGSRPDITLWSPDGELLQNLKGHKWEEKRAGTEKGHGSYVRSLDWHPSGERFASASNDETVKIWSRDGKEERSLPQPAGALTASWSPDGEWLAGGGGDSKNTFLHLVRPDGTPGPKFQGHDNYVTSVDWHPDGESLISAEANKDSLYAWDVNGRQKSVRNLPEESAVDVRWNPQGTHFVSGGRRGVSIWTTGSTKPEMHIPHANSGMVTWAPSGTRFAFGGGYNELSFAAMDGETETLFPLGDTLNDGDWGSNDRIAVALADGRLLVWNPNTQQPEWIAVFRPAGPPVTFNARGEIIHGLDAAVEDDFLYVVKDERERVHTLKPSEFEAFRNSGKTFDEWKNPPQAAAEPLSQPGPAEDVLPGLVPRPAKLPGVKRWQACRRGLDSTCNVAWSPDGRWIATCSPDAEDSSDGHIRIFNGETLRLEKVFVGHTRSVNALAWSPDSSKLATGGWDETIRVWNVDGALQAVIENPTGLVTLLAWSPTSEWIASANYKEGSVHLWRPDGTPGPVIRQPTIDVYGLAWDAEGKRIATGNKRGAVFVWEVDGTPAGTFQGDESVISALMFSLDGTQLAAGSQDQLHIWQLADQLLLSSTTIDAQGGASRCLTIYWNPNSKSITAIWPRALVEYVLETKNLRKLELGRSFFNYAAFNRQGDRIVIFEGYRGIHIYSLEKQLQPFVPASYNQMSSVAWSPRGDRLAVGTESDGVVICRPDGVSIERFDNSAPPLAWSPDGGRLVSLSENDVRIWHENKPARTIRRSFEEPISALGWSRDGNRLYIGSSKGTVAHRALESDDWKEFAAHDALVWSIAASPDNETLATSGSDRAIRLWTLDGQPKSRVEVEAPGGAIVRSVTWNADGTRLTVGASGRRSDAVPVWATDGTQLADLKGHEDNVLAVAWNPHGPELASASRDGEIRIWYGDGPHVLKGHTGAVWSLDWSPDGKRLLSGSSDNTFRVWDTATGHAVWSALVADGVYTVVFAPGGKILHADPQAERQVVYVVEDTTGRQHTLTPAQFNEFVGSGKPFGEWRQATETAAVRSEQPSSAAKPNSLTPLQRIIDDGDPGYADTSKDNTKGWQPGRDDEAKTGGYGGDYRINHAGALTARWTFDELPAGKYAVFSTWPDHPSAAQKCVYVVDAGDGANHQVAVSQQQRPNDEQAEGFAWKRLGTFEVTNGKLTVELDARVSTGPNTIADAVRIVRVE